jgi:GT2 family glycosyltransferase
MVAFDGCPVEPAIRARLDQMEARAVSLPERRGPGAARNAGAREARGEWLAFTEDDCVPARDWLEQAAERIETGASVDVIEGETVSPGGAPVRRRDGMLPNYLPTNLFVRRDLFGALGGYCEQFFDAASGIYFREDSDFGFMLEEAGARVALLPGSRVIHPREHPGFLDPFRWARRYEMDALLARRHPARFRNRIEATRVGPFRLRRSILRASFAYVLALFCALAAVAAGHRGLATLLAGLALLPLILLWAKWRFQPARLPLLPIVPFVLVGAVIRGHYSRRTRGRTPPSTLS